MSRTIDATLRTGLANQQGEPVIRVLTWSSIADYNSNPNTPDHTWVCTDFDIWNTRAKATLVTANDYTISEFGVFLIERGLKIQGTEYTIKSGLFFVRDYFERYGYIDITGSSYPNTTISIAGDDTYENVIDAFCAAIGKTGRFKNETVQWLNYQFLPAGKTISLNKAEYFENMLRQKYTILVYEESPKSLVFYMADDYPTYSVNWKSVAWSPELGLFAVVANTLIENRVITSDNGTLWQTHDSAGDKSWNSVCWSPELGLFCAVCGTGEAATSPDGDTWTLRAAISASWQSVCWSPELGLFCAVTSNAVMTSPNGINWTSRTAAAANFWKSVAWSPELGLFCAVAQDGTANRVMTSPNGINWTSQTSTDYAWQSVCWSPELGLFCAVAPSSGGANGIMTSPDGINWTSQSITNAWQSVCWSPELGLFCAVASLGTQRVMTSPDGVNWTKRTIPLNNWFSVTWSPELGLFCAVASWSETVASIITSPDGTNWTVRSSGGDFELSYLDGPISTIVRSQHEVHYFWVDETEATHTSGTTTNPLWNLGYLESTDSPPTTKQDPYYKIFLQKAPVRLDITDGDKINFAPYWSIDPTKTIDAMMQVSEHFHAGKAPAWYQEIRSIVMFDSVEGGALPSTIERVANYTPLNTTNFDGNLSSTDNNVQAAFDTLDDMSGGAKPHAPGGYATLVTGTPVPTSDQLAKTAIYWTPDINDLAIAWNGTTWLEENVAELTLNLDSDSGHTGYHQSGKLFDLFLFNDSGTWRFVSGPAWTNDTTRATALEYKNGVKTNAASMTARFGSAAGDTVTVPQNQGTHVATFRASANGQVEDSEGGTSSQTGGKRFLWNRYNQKPKAIKVIDTTDYWAYTTDTIRQANGAAGNKIELVIGEYIRAIRAVALGVTNVWANNTKTAKVGPGIDATNAFNGLIQGGYNNDASAQQYHPVTGTFEGYIAAGYHYISWNEKGADGNCYFVGDRAGDSQQCGLLVTAWM